jgi:hypothetical protein
MNPLSLIQLKGLNYPRKHTPSPPLLAPFGGLVADFHLTAERCRGLSEPNARLITISELDTGRFKGAL